MLSLRHQTHIQKRSLSPHLRKMNIFICASILSFYTFFTIDFGKNRKIARYIFIIQLLRSIYLVVWHAYVHRALWHPKIYNVEMYVIYSILYCQKEIARLHDAHRICHFHPTCPFQYQSAKKEIHISTSVISIHTACKFCLCSYNEYSANASFYFAMLVSPLLISLY